MADPLRLRGLFTKNVQAAVHSIRRRGAAEMGSWVCGTAAGKNAEGNPRFACGLCMILDPSSALSEIWSQPQPQLWAGVPNHRGPGHYPVPKVKWLLHAMTGRGQQH